MSLGFRVRAPAAALFASTLFAAASSDARPRPGETCDEYVERERRELLTEHPDATPEEVAAYEEGERRECEEEGAPDSGRTETYETTTVGTASRREGPIPAGTTRVSRRQMEERMPRSAPDALRFEPGVYVQQTAHAQGSAYIRGLTGQQTVMLYDGVRLNNSLYRQGPNQYFFTVDSHTISSLDVTRGSASVLWGSDALGGVIEANPLEPSMREGETGLAVIPRTTLRLASADDEMGGRFELDAQLGDRWGFIGGAGYRDVGRLRAGGEIHDSVLRYYSGGERQLVPKFDDDGVTQLGTGFREATWDGRLVYRLGESSRVVAAYYDYRQFDAPRTDKCPAPFAQPGDCLVYEEQFRELGYVAVEGDLGAAAGAARVTLSVQRQHERKRLDRPSSLVNPQYGVDDALTLGLSARARTRPWSMGRDLALGLRYGADVYRDEVSSDAWYEIHTERNDLVTHRSRGQYLDGSSYTWGGAFLQGEGTVWRSLHARLGARATRVQTYAPADEESGSLEVDRGWTSVAGGAGVAWDVTPSLTVALNVDQGFRAPNLDDLTSRQLTGPGFQFENDDLVPERSLTVELGVEWQLGPLRLAAWGYRMSLQHAMARRPASDEMCPPETQECQSSWFKYQLVNLDGEAQVLGAEGVAYLKLPLGLSARATLAYAYGEGPNPADEPEGGSVSWEPTVPLSRIPPTNGTIELLWHTRRFGFYAGAAMRWALEQDRLAPQDEGDARIPLGGTPGYAVFDLRVGYRLGRRVAAGLVFENVGDLAYRYHGSSVNGPGRGLVATLQLGL